MRWMLAALVTTAACHDLPDLGICGNGIIEAARGEACDGGKGCTAECQLSCATSEGDQGYVKVGIDVDNKDVYCPDERYGCGADRICRAPSGAFEPLAASLPFDVTGSPVLGDVDSDGLADLVGTSATNIYIRFASAAGTPLGEAVIQQAPSSNAPIAIFDLQPRGISFDGLDVMIAVPTEGIALLQSDGASFSPQLDLPLPVMNQARAFVVRDPDPALGDVVMAVQSVSPSSSIGVARAPLPGVATPPPLPPCVGAAGQAWTTVDVEIAPDRRSFVVVTQRASTMQQTAQPWHVCRYSHNGAGWALADFEVPAPTSTPSSIALANLDPDACLELAVRSDAGPGLFMIDAALPSCGFVPTVGPLRSAGVASALLGAGSIVPGDLDELVLADGVFHACVGPADCGSGNLPGTFVRVIAPTKGAWTAVAAVDLNRDGALDVVAAREEPDVDVVRGGAVPNIYRANTSERVASLVAGDFDGDRLGDVAMVESSPPGDRISILYGTPDANVGTPRPMSALDPRTLMMPRRLRLDRVSEIHWSPTILASDGIDDLLVIDTGRNPPVAGLVVGDAARLMTTPRFPPMPSERPLGAVAAGAFGSDNVEVMAISDTNVLLYNAMANSWVDPPPPLPAGVVVRKALGSLRNGNRSRAVAGGATDHDVAVFSIGMGAPPPCAATLTVVPDELRGIDLDGDGVDELAVISGTGTGRTLQLYRVTGCPLVPLLVDELAGCIDVANLGERLIAICKVGMQPVQRGVFEITKVGDDFVKAAVPRAVLDGNGDFITAGDFDGDGVLDAAIGVNRGGAVSVQVLRQCPAHDLRRCP